MLYYLHEMQRLSMAPARLAAEATKYMMKNNEDAVNVVAQKGLEPHRHHAINLFHSTLCFDHVPKP